MQSAPPLTESPGNAAATVGEGESPDDPYVEDVEEDDEWAPPPHTRRRGAYILALITLTGLVVLLMLGLIFRRWLTVVEPTTAIVVEGASPDEGAVVTVTGPNNVPGTPPREMTVTLTKDNGYIVPFLLSPGEYSIVADPLEGRAMAYDGQDIGWVAFASTAPSNGAGPRVPRTNGLTVTRGVGRRVLTPARLAKLMADAAQSKGGARARSHSSP